MLNIFFTKMKFGKVCFLSNNVSQKVLSFMKPDIVSTNIFSIMVMCLLIVDLPSVTLMS